jgi:hypothetical protein
MTVQDTETPGGQDQQSRAGKQDADEVYGQCPFLAIETGGERIYQERRGQESGEDEDGNHQGQEGAYSSGNLVGLGLSVTSDERGVDWDEGR